MSSGSGNGSGRYEEITGIEEIIAGIGNDKDAKEIGDFLMGWSDWLVELINMVKDFFEKIKYAIENKGQ